MMTVRVIQHFENHLRESLGNFCRETEIAVSRFETTRPAAISVVTIGISHNCRRAALEFLKYLARRADREQITPKVLDIDVKFFLAEIADLQ